jgi:hypothetical protein
LVISRENRELEINADLSALTSRNDVGSGLEEHAVATISLGNDLVVEMGQVTRNRSVEHRDLAKNKEITIDLANQIS